MTVEALNPLQRPGLAYQQAFDWLAVQLQASSGAAAALAPTAFHGVELLRRRPDLPILKPLPDGLSEAAAALGITLQSADFGQTAPAVLAWAEPPASAVEQLASLSARVQPGARLYLVTPGPLGRFLTERRAAMLPQAMTAGQALRLLVACGWRVRQRLGLHGPRAVGWHYASELARAAGRPYRRDRYHFAMRRDFLERGTLARLSALVLIVAERIV